MSLGALTLYGYWRSSSAWRVRIALNLKGIAYRSQSVHLVRDGGEQHRDEFAAKNPLHQVPVLEFEGPEGSVRLTQSVAIIEWLEEQQPKPRLLPESPLLRARARELMEICNSGIQPMHNLSTLLAVEGLGSTRVAWAGPRIAKGLTSAEAIVAEVAEQFAVGALPSAADAFIVPQLFAARRFEVDLGPFPTLRRIEASCMAVDAFRKAHPDQQPDAPKDN